MSDLDIVFPQGKKLEIGGTEVTVKQFTLGQIPKVMRAMRKAAQPMIDMYNKDEKPDLTTAIEVFADTGEDLIELMADCIKMPQSFVNELDPDDGLKLITAFFEVNADFFIKKVLPEVKNLLAKKQQAGLK